MPPFVPVFLFVGEVGAVSSRSFVVVPGALVVGADPADEVTGASTSQAVAANLDSV